MREIFIELIRKEINNKGMTLNNGFSIIMLNNSIIHGNVDSKEVEKRNLENTKNEIKKNKYSDKIKKTKCI